MKRVIKLILPTKSEVFVPTIKAFAKAYNYICEYGYNNKQFNNLRLHHETYKHIRTFLPAALAIAARIRAHGNLKVLKYKIKKGNCVRPTSSRKHFSIQYSNNHSYSINHKKNEISILTIDGRKKFPLPFIPQHFHKYFTTWKRKGMCLFIRNNKVHIHINFEKNPDEIETSNSQVVGLDRGINNIAVLSNNQFHSGKQVKKKTQQIRKLRSKLQKVGSKSAKRHLGKLSQKENRFRRDINHQISKRIVNSLPAGSTLVLEDLSGLNSRSRKKLGKRFNKQLNSWAYYQLEQFLTYKGEEKGIKIVKIDPSYTSQRCSCCGHTERKNRKGSNFKCLSCGFQLNADLNASRNIKEKWLNGQCPASRATQSSGLSFLNQRKL